MTPPATIDLGDLAGEGPVPRWRAFPPQLWRSVAVGAIAPLCLLAVTASQPTPSGLGRPLWTVDQPAGSFVIGTDAVYGVAADGTVTARDLRTGAARFTVNQADPRVRVVDAGTVLALAGSGDTRLVDRAGRITAVVPGSAVGSTRSGRRLIVRDRDQVSAWDLRTRAVAWSTGVHELVVDLDPGGRVDALATVAPDGTISVRDADTGDVVDRLRPRPFGVAAAPDTQVIFFRGDLVTAVRDPAGALLLTLYRPRAVGWPRAGAWSLSLPLAARYLLSACGPAVCVARPGSGTTVIDPDRGRPRGRTPDHVVGQLGGGLLLATTTDNPTADTGTSWSAASVTSTPSRSPPRWPTPCRTRSRRRARSSRRRWSPSSGAPRRTPTRWRGRRGVAGSSRSRR